MVFVLERKEKGLMLLEFEENLYYIGLMAETGGLEVD